ncbi:DUF4386 family protein [Temperatibacter marinus]|uniref:DUF4386 family protein n=1 Tax=Temperatibacter marinus TaxID=1456591 RepID=A0AA52EC05_9PROT|nr:DUF4386 family protein [Temperatibacter marinus]WND02011.1 DUF4386 family protein [Temperatibacter marinus]
MTAFQKIGGLAAWGQALCYIIGFTIFIFFLDFPSSDKPLEAINFLIDNKMLILSAMTIIYILAALILLILVLALHEKLKSDNPLLMQISTATGLIWAGVVVASGMIFTVGAESVIKVYEYDPDRAATLWIAVGIIQNGLGGGTEFLGGVWILLISWVAYKGDHLSKALNWLGFGIGIIGIASVVPSLSFFVDIFGLSQIIWFLWLGTVMLFTAKTN